MFGPGREGWKMFRKVMRFGAISLGVMAIIAALIIVLAATAQYILEERIIAECEAQGGVVMNDAWPGPYCIEKRTPDAD